MAAATSDDTPRHEHETPHLNRRNECVCFCAECLELGTGECTCPDNCQHSRTRHH